jgi:hypothetical protein
LFEIGAGAGHDSKYFSDHGLTVVATDLSPKMVAMCPNSDFGDALASIRQPLKPGALFYLGLYGGPEPFEGILATDWHVPRRFFSFRTDSQVLAAVEPHFRVEDFHIIQDDRYFQALTLRALA